MSVTVIYTLSAHRISVRYKQTSLIRSIVSADWDRAFDAELRLRFFKGFVWTRVVH
jgi:hypothetical protein